MTFLVVHLALDPIQVLIRSKQDHDIEVLALRQQLRIAQRQVPSHWAKVTLAAELATVAIQGIQSRQRRSCRPAVVVMQSSQHWEGHDGRGHP